LYRYVGHPIPGGKPISFIFTQSFPDEQEYSGDLATFMAQTKKAGFVPVGHLVAADLSKGQKPMVTENKAYMRAAYELGKNLL